MKYLIKYAVGAAIAGALVNMLMRQRSRQPNISPDAGDRQSDIGNRESHGEQATGTFSDAAREQRGPQPDDWRGAQNVLGS